MLKECPLRTHNRVVIVITKAKEIGKEKAQKGEHKARRRFSPRKKTMQ